jgi:hypothetical protein
MTYNYKSSFAMGYDFMSDLANRTCLFAILAAVLVSFCSTGSAQYARRATAATAARGTMGNGGVRQVATGASLGGLQVGLHSFAADMGRMPTQAEGLNALITRPPGAKNWRGPYIATNNFKPTFSDPWGSLYRYVVTPAGRSNMYSIVSNGPDRLPGTKDDLAVQF